MGGKDTEACGRCAMSTVVDAATEGERDPFGEERIEIDDDELRRLSPGAWFSGVKTRLDDAATRFIYGR
ncbi:hypothetical protein [Natronomonas sp. EA1]|uniref:hypothetical protein n=1 Tax=Natronomonas sp. EA1 TaxID=3421655 RepID=UPI003EBB1063